jgi:hypothetical protein
MAFSFFIDELLEPTAHGLSFLVLLYFIGKNNTVKLKSLTIYFFTATLLVLKAAFSNPNIEIYSFLSLFSCICIGLYFYYTLYAKWKKRVVIFLGVIQAGYYVTGNFLFPSPPVFDSAGYVILSMSVVFMAFMFMHQILTNITEEPLSHSFDFWFVSSQLFYYLGSFFIFLTYGYLTKKLLASNLYSYENRIYLSQLWRVHNVLLFLSALIISVSILWISFRRKSPSLL